MTNLMLTQYLNSMQMTEQYFAVLRISISVYTVESLY